MPTESNITDADRELAEEITDELMMEDDADIVAAIIARHREKMAGRVKHCGRCGSDWADNGINSGCPCVLLAEHQKREKVLVEALRWIEKENPQGYAPGSYIGFIAKIQNEASKALKEHNQ